MSSVAVDVPTDVGQGIFVRGLPLTVYPVAEHLIFGQVFHDQTSQRGSGSLMTLTDLARCGSCGIPSAWRSPTTRWPSGSPRRNRCMRHVALPLGCRVVALGGGRRDATPCPPWPSRSDSCPAILEACLPGEGMV
jgi:hypothetical protein